MYSFSGARSASSAGRANRGFWGHLATPSRASSVRAQLWPSRALCSPRQQGQSGARPHDLDVFAHHAGPSCRPGRGRRSRRQPTAASPLAGQLQPDVAQGAPERDLLRLALHQQGFGRPIAVALGDNDAMSIPEIRLLFQWHRHSLFHPVRRANSKLKAKRSDRVQAQARRRAIVSRSLAP